MNLESLIVLGFLSALGYILYIRSKRGLQKTFQARAEKKAEEVHQRELEEAGNFVARGFGDIMFVETTSRYVLPSTVTRTEFFEKLESKLRESGTEYAIKPFKVRGTLEEKSIGDQEYLAVGHDCCVSLIGAVPFGKCLYISNHLMKDFPQRFGLPASKICLLTMKPSIGMQDTVTAFYSSVNNCIEEIQNSIGQEPLAAEPVLTSGELGPA